MFFFHSVVAADADLMEKLGEPGNYTVFAVTDDGFQKLSEDMRTKLQKGKSCIKSKFLMYFMYLNICTIM